LPAAGLYAGLTAVVLWPVFSVPIPGLGDYLNHLARIHILTTLNSSAALRQFYEIRWNFAPYLGMDLVVSLLAHIMPLYQAGRVFLAICVVLPVASACALRYAALGRVGLAPACVFLLSYNYALSLGFLDYVFSACLALLLLAGWIAASAWPRLARCALFSVGLTIVYLCHPFAFVAYCLGVAGVELARASRARFQPWRPIALDWVAAAATSVPALWLATHVDLAKSFAGPPITVFGTAAVKLGVLLSPVLFPGTGYVVAATVLASLAGGFLMRSRIRLAPSLWPAAAAILLAASGMPHVLVSVWGADFRLPLVGAIVLIAAVSCVPPPSARLSACAMVILVGLVAGKSIAVFRVLQVLDSGVTQERALVAHMPAGQRLLVVDATGPEILPAGLPEAMIMHIPMVAVVDRDAFVPYLFVDVTQVHLRASIASAGSGNGTPISVAQLWDGRARSDIAGSVPYGFSGRVYWNGWPDKFDYVLVQTFSQPLPSLPPELEPVAGSADATLFRIRGGRKGG
jgi:hypothetical protein